jgi:release factor glutamine methyltransferase
MKSAIGYLQRKGIENARLNVELLLAHALNLQRIQLYLQFDKPLTEKELERFRVFFERRLNHEPLQYIIGTTSFMGLLFKVDERVFIPRPETESLLEQVMLICHRYQSDESINILEIGTGSGNIAIAIAKYVKQARITTIDISSEALDLARQNAQMHLVESYIKFYMMDVFRPSEDFFQKHYDLLVSNPPYIAKDEWEQLQKEVRDYEPPVAVTDGRDGFRFYRRIAEIVPKILKIGGSVVIEVGFGQVGAVVHELQKARIEQIHVTHDLQGIPRVVSGTWLGPNSTLISLN